MSFCSDRRKLDAIPGYTKARYIVLTLPQRRVDFPCRLLAIVVVAAVPSC